MVAFTGRLSDVNSRAIRMLNSSAMQADVLSVILSLLSSNRAQQRKFFSLFASTTIGKGDHVAFFYSECIRLRWIWHSGRLSMCLWGCSAWVCEGSGEHTGWDSLRVCVEDFNGCVKVLLMIQFSSFMVNHATGIYILVNGIPPNLSRCSLMAVYAG